jgi:hypothetical protein
MRDEEISIGMGKWEERRPDRSLASYGVSKETSKSKKVKEAHAGQAKPNI